MQRIRDEIFGAGRLQHNQLAAAQEYEWNKVCSDVILSGEKICQFPYFYNGSFLCAACAVNCQAHLQAAISMDHISFPFQCQCDNMGQGGACKYKNICRIDPQSQ